jgi:methyltransferase (TIGR00027 family)
MDPGRASMTALGTSLIRAAHTRLDRPALIDDPWGERLVTATERDALLQVGLVGLDPVRRQGLEALGSPEAVWDATVREYPMYGWVVVRMRYAEDALEAAVLRGVRQYVIVGAGMDSFALRSPAYAQAIEVFEVDHPATQEFKRRRLRDCQVPLPERLHFVAADLSLEGLDAALARSSFRRDQPAFFSWLGVTTYLTREANLATLRAIAGCGAHGGELVFTYVDQRELDPDPDPGDLQQVRAMVRAMDEPWVSGFHPSELAEVLDGVGLALVEDLGGEELRLRYCADRTDNLSSPPAFHVALARVNTNR